MGAKVEEVAAEFSNLFRAGGREEQHWFGLVSHSALEFVASVVVVGQDMAEVAEAAEVYSYLETEVGPVFLSR